MPLAIVCVRACVRACSVKDIKEERGNQGPKGPSRVRGGHPEGGKEGEGSFYKRCVGLIWEGAKK